MARPRKTADEPTILALASKGRTMSEIAAYFDMTDDTLRKHYSDVIARGKSLMRGSLRSKQYEVAMRGNPQMLIWLGKQLLEQADKSEVIGEFRHELTNLTNLSDEQLRQVESLIETADAAASKG